MTVRTSVEQVLAHWTSTRLLTTVQQMTQGLSSTEAATVEINTLLDAILGDLDFGSASNNWAARLQVKRWLAATMAGMPELRFVEGDA